jgi:hypothetical protein
LCSFDEGGALSRFIEVGEAANIGPVGVTVRCSGSATSSRHPVTLSRTAQMIGVEAVTGPLTENQNAGVSSHIEIRTRRCIDPGQRPFGVSRTTPQRSIQTIITKLPWETTCENTAVGVFRIRIIWQKVLWIQILDWS